MQTQSVKGVRDFYPEEMLVRNWLFDKFRQASNRFGFDEFDPCVLEHEELYLRKAGEDISDQLYSFPDKAGRRLSLRPEVTPSLARMVLARHKELHLPLRWYCIAQCFRYERMQKGRKREHYQWNMDFVGEPGIRAELELLAAVVDFFLSVGLTDKDVVIRFSNRKLLWELLGRLNVPEERKPEVSIVLDKLQKIGAGAVESTLVEKGVDPSVARKITSFVESETMEEMERAAGYSPAALSEVRDLVERSRAYGIEAFLRFAPSLVRGLSYYTGTVFEAFESSGAGRAICGGGRYDHLLELFGGPPTPMVGFGFGDVVITDILSERAQLPTQEAGFRVLVASYSDAESNLASRLALTLRKANVQTRLDFLNPKLGRLLTQGARDGFRFVAFAAPDEAREGKVWMKDLRAGTEFRASLDTAASMIQKAQTGGT